MIGTLWVVALAQGGERDLVFPIPDRAPTYDAVLPDQRDRGTGGTLELWAHKRWRGAWDAGTLSNDDRIQVYCLWGSKSVSVALGVKVEDWPSRLPEEIGCASERGVLRIWPVSVPSLEDPSVLEPGTVRHVRHYTTELGRWLRLPEDRWVVTEENAESLPWRIPGDSFTLGRCFVRRDAEGRALLYFDFPMSDDGKEGTCTLPRQGAPPVPFHLVPELVRVPRRAPRSSGPG
jgi:hypothetical protein